MSYSWHIQWQSLFDPDCREVITGCHRADIKVHDTVIELQRSPITTMEMSEREQFYHNLIWIFPVRQRDFSWHAEESLNRDQFYVKFWLERDFPDVWWRPQTPVLLHIGGQDMIWITELEAYGYGIYIQRSILVDRFKNGDFQCPANNLYRLPGIKSSLVEIR